MVSRHVTSPFPICKLYSITIRDRLPPGCPAGADDPLGAVHQIEDRGYREFDVADPHPSIEAWAVSKICETCVVKQSQHRTFVKLRTQLCKIA